MKTDRGPLKPSVLAWVDLLRLYYSVTRRAEKELREEGLTLPRFDVVAQLGAVEEPCTQETLCEKLLVTKGNISALIDRMVREGLVSRQQDPSDRRCNRIQLTPRGKRLFRDVVPKHEACLDRVFSGLRRDEQIQLKNLLRKLLKSMREREERG